MKKMKITIAIVAAGLFSTYAGALELRLSSDIGTTGPGIYAATPLQQNWILRVGTNFLNYSRSVSSSNLSYDVNWKARNLDFLIDWYALNGNFRISAGLIYNASKMQATGTPTGGVYSLNGNTYNVAQYGNVSTNVEFNKLAPYLGVGWESNQAPRKKWGFTSDFGVIFQGNPNANLTSNGCTASVAGCAQLANDLTTENGNVNDALHQFRFYPVARIGLNYKF